MARIGHPLRLCVVVLGLLLATGSAAHPADDPTQVIATTLAIQDAMRQGRDLLQRGQAKAAVEVLEAQLTRINGNPTYLALLREAYYAYLKELQLSHQDELCATYLKRLQILDKDARTAAPPVPPKAEVPIPKAEIVSRDDDPLQQTPRRRSPAGRELLPEAERAFAEKRYQDADELFTRAFGTEPADTQYAPQWAYSKLNGIVARLREAEAAGGTIPTTELENEVQAALRMAAENAELGAFGRNVLASIRQQGSAAPARPVTIKHFERGPDGWARAESPNFQLFHNQPREAAEQLLRSAEQARAAAFDKWAGASRGDWQPACEIYWHATAADYARNTSKPANSPGHATYKLEGSKVVRRRLDLRADEPNTLVCVVPHETTHLVVGDLFADAPLPRWADEGLAILAEPRAQIDRYDRTLITCRKQGTLIPLDQVLGRPDYPEAKLITPFYVESVSVTEFLVAEKGPQTFLQFLRDVQQSGVETALARHYNCHTVADLQQRWLVHVVGKMDAPAAGR